MKFTYPIVLTPDDDGYVVFVPDFNINTEGSTLGEAIEMAMDAIGLMGIDLEDGENPLPQPSQMESVAQISRDDIVTAVAVDFSKYRKSLKQEGVLPW